MSTLIRDFKVPHGTIIGAQQDNYLHLTGSIAGNSVGIAAEGIDTNIGITITPKGNGEVHINGNVNITATSGLSFAGYTPNTVLYVDSNSSAASSASLAFDGTNLTVGGSVTASSFIPTSFTAPTHGIYSYAANSVGISANSTGVIFVTSGKVGIGQTPTTYVLETSHDVSIHGLRVGLGNAGISSNIVLGTSSLSNNTTGNNNISVGNCNLNSNTAGANNISLGNSTLRANVLGQNNIGIGNSSLTNSTTGVLTLGAISGGSNYTPGIYTGVSLTRLSGSTPTALPIADVTIVNGTVVSVNIVNNGAGFIDNTTVFTAPSSAIGNTGSGFCVPVSSLVSGNENIGIGYSSLYSNKIGSHNVGIGTSSLYSNTSGNNNIGSGFSSLYSNTIGNDNIAIGDYSLYKNTTGCSNLSNGTNSLHENNTGCNNISLGNWSLYSNTCGSNNISIGVMALQSNSQGNNNVAIGHTSGYNPTIGITTACNNTFIGYGTTSCINGINNSTALGNGAIVTDSNQMVYGNTSVTVNLMNGTLLVGTTSNINNSTLVVNGVIESLSGGIRFPDGTVLTSATSGTLTTYTTTSTQTVPIDSFFKTSYRTAKYLVQIERVPTQSFHVIELLLIHNGNQVYLSQYGEIYTNSSLGLFDASILGDSVNLLFTPTTAITNLRILRQTLVV